MALSSSDWKLIDDLVASVGSSESVGELDTRLVERVAEIVPSDAHVDLFAVRPGRGILLRAHAGASISETWMHRWTERYRFVIPEGTDLRAVTQTVEWFRCRRSEYACDFMLPQGIGRSLYLFIPVYSRNGVDALVIHRERAHRFTSREVAILRTLQRHLQNGYHLLRQIERNRREQFHFAELARKSSRLSVREAEIASLLCRRLTAPQIAERLGISRRTVECHAAHIYRKLDLTDRSALISLLSKAGPGLQAEPIVPRDDARPLLRPWRPTLRSAVSPAS